MRNTKIACLLATCALLSAPQADAAEKVRVFIMAGQSNMQGLGQADWGVDYLGFNSETNKHEYSEAYVGGPGSLRHYAQTVNPAAYGHLLDANGDWKVRDDVFIWSRNGQDLPGIDDDDSKDNDTLMGNLTIGYGARPSSGRLQIGPEFGFGHAVGDAFDDQVAIIKIAWGGKALAYDFRPPSARDLDPSDPQYIDWTVKGVRQDGSGRDNYPPENVGKYYDLTVSNVKDALVDLAAQFPDKELELTGFAWHQGFNDRLDTQFRTQYGENLKDFITDIRDDLDAPDLPFVLATTSQNPTYRATRTLQMITEQLSVTDPDDPNFVDNTAGFDTSDLWREVEESPRPDGAHWNQNGETYYLIGDTLGQEMVTLVPEPASLTLLGVCGLLITRRRREVSRHSV
ncbi:MAG: sialate O-acetylesterase [Phycisphaeraceae bacterium]